MVYEFDGTKPGKLRDMQAARRAKPPDPVRGGVDFTRAARAVGVSKRTVTAWRNGMTRCRPRQPGSREPMVMTGDRPAEVADRGGPGHREGDLVCGAGNRSVIGTLVERATRFTILLHLPDGHAAEHVRDAIIGKMRPPPALPRNSPAWDRGSEPALHTRVSAAPGMQAYFRDPHSPWQRGTNENTNSLPRQYSPKGTDPSGYTEEHLDAATMEPNDRPRKTPDHMKPNEKTPELTDDTATSTPTNTNNTNCQQRCCDDH